jgi:protein-S-isoprenylcysteine O-methyltransferase Ste14
MKSKISETQKATIGTLLFLLLILPIFLVWIPCLILATHNQNYFFDIGIIRYTGIIPIVTGVVIYLWCSHSFISFGQGTPVHFTQTKKLIVAGLYRFVRNPMYIGALLVIAGEALIFQSVILIFYALAAFGVLTFFLRFFEEPYLADKFGKTYNGYHKSVPRWIPRLTPYRGSGYNPGDPK